MKLTNDKIKYLKEYLLIVIGVMSAGFGLKGFLLPNNFIDGGAVGISLLVAEVSNISLSVLIIIVNIPFIIMAYRTISLEFAVKTIFGIVILAFVTAFLPYPEITNDKLLISIFGGFFLGGGIGLAIRGGGVIDGTEVLAISLSKKLNLSVGDIILIINIIIFSVAAYLLSIEIALYSILTYLSASKTVDFIVEGIEEYNGLSIISEKNEEIRQMLINKLGHGVTIYKGERGINDETTKDINIIFTAVTRLEVGRLIENVKNIDPDAFIILQSIKDTKGGMIKQRPLK